MVKTMTAKTPSHSALSFLSACWRNAAALVKPFELSQKVIQQANFEILPMSY